MAARATESAPRTGRTETDGEPDDEAALPEGTQLLWRRGWLSRSPDGAWTFVFAADAAGQADPPLNVLPCLLLERMERYATTAGAGAPMVLSGVIYRYKKRGYLLPTAFEVPRLRTQIAP